MNDTATEPASAQFTVFRHNDAKPLQITQFTGLNDVSRAGLAAVQKVGGGAGSDVRTVLDVPGFSITYAWFKSGYPLPRHSHHAPCAYYIIAGSLRLGKLTLEKGDGFFVPAGTPYTYEPGPEGVEVLEVRHQACSDFHMLANNSSFWERAVSTMEDRRPHWNAEPQPAQVALRDSQI